MNQISFARNITNVRLNLFVAVAIVGSAVAAIGCGGGGGAASTTTYQVSTDTITCKSQSLQITDTYPIPQGTKVTFHNTQTNQDYDGSAVRLNNGDLDCGFPSNAPAGSYEVEVTTPGGHAEPIANITYNAGNC